MMSGSMSASSGMRCSTRSGMGMSGRTPVQLSQTGHDVRIGLPKCALM